MLAACGRVGRRQGPPFVAFYGCMYYAMMRPSEVGALTRSGCYLPEEGWGHLTFADASPLVRPGVHRRRPDPRAPRAEGTDPGETQPRPASP
jgi:hypothetical protein